MPHIQQLSSHVADLIAAGEVVERPASVVKELVENAIDAGASAIVVEIQRGGMGLIRVTDNGCGIAPEELPTAFLRHATSKLRTAEDLAKIGTLGFRGEALAAISAVSRVDVLTRRPGDTTGSAIHGEGGHMEPVREEGAPEGTTIRVADLFYNTPARLKFMKKDSAETAAVAGLMQHLALSHPDVSFKFIKDGQEALHTPGDGKLESAVYAALGREFAKTLVPVQGRGGDIEVRGFVTAPVNGRGSRSMQVFFVNGRFIKSQLLTAALEEAYKNQLLKGRFPGCVLHVTLPADRVDVNVHPAKTVVKFVSDKAVFDAVYYTILDALNAEKAPKKPDNAPEFFRKMTAQEFKEKAAAPAEEKKPLGSFLPKSAAPATKNVIRDSVPAMAQRPHSAETVYVRDVAEPEKPIVTSSPLTGRTYEITPPVKAETLTEKPVEPETVAVPEAPAQETITMPQEPEQQTMEPVKEAPWRMVGEVLKTYIICEDEHETVWLIDKHAAHERLRFDVLKANRQPLMAQPLLTPETVELEPESYAAVLDNLPLLQEFGFVCEDFGGGTVLIREVPADILAADAAVTLEELAQKLALGRADPNGARDELLHTMACKSAIKAGMTTDATELAALVEKVQSGEILYCPHGRPVKYQLSKYDIEKMFKRA